MEHDLMSIYRTYRPVRSDVHVDASARNGHSRDSCEQDSAHPVHLRRAQPTESLLARTVLWIHRLPEPVQPHALAKQYARIANLLCAVWQDVAACRKYFTELLVDNRGGREGFPQAVLQEIQALQEYYLRLYAPSEVDGDEGYATRSVWDGPERNERGFTLIELVIAMAIVAILAAIALPSYAAFMRKSVRADAQTFITGAANRQQQYLADRRTYADSLSALNAPAPASVAGKFSFTVVVTDGPPPTFTITGTATGEQSKDACPVLSIDSAGNRSPAGCW
jgi:type IV pilus assembly protein PilE